MKVRLKAVKQDQRLERPGAAAGEDWVYIGDAPGFFSIRDWLARVYSWWPAGRAQADPFFLAPDTRRPWRYGDALTCFKEIVARVNQAAAAKVGFHSLRVAGWNSAKSCAAGPELAVAHGGWASRATAGRYDRFNLNEVLQLAAHQASQAAPRAPLPADDGRDEAAAGDAEDDAHVSPPPAAAPASPQPRILGSARPARRATFAGLGSPSPAVCDGADSAAIGRSPRARQPPSGAAPSPSSPTPRSRRKAPRVLPKVMVPSHLWPSFECAEFEGRGWLAEVIAVDGPRSTVRYVHWRNSRGNKSRVTLLTDVLVPVADESAPGGAP